MLEELTGLLMIYEMTCKAYNEYDEHENNFLKNIKDLTLCTNEDQSSESSSDADLELLKIKLKKFLK